MNPTDCSNGTVIPSIEGVNYTQYCFHDLPGHDRDSTETETLNACTDACTRHGPACFGVTWDSFNKKCYLKDYSANASDLKPVDRATMSALAIKSQYEQQRTDIVCPYPNLSTQKSRSGMDFDILCGGLSTFNREVPLDKVHVQSLDDCMERCATYHPLCTRLFYAADLIGMGWLNCVLLKSSDDDLVVPYTRTMGHSAEAVIEFPDKPNWKNGSIQVDKSGRSFIVSRDDFRGLNDDDDAPFATYHEKNIQDCIERCSRAEPECITAIFDSGLQQGFLNCYLFDKFPPPQGRHSDFTFFYLQSLSKQYQSPPAKGVARLRGGPIAGVVVGSIAALAVIIWFLWRRKWPWKSKLKSG